MASPKLQYRACVAKVQSCANSTLIYVDKVGDSDWCMVERLLIHCPFLKSPRGFAAECDMQLKHSVAVASKMR